jgi:hypothetical protein
MSSSPLEHISLDTTLKANFKQLRSALLNKKNNHLVAKFSEERLNFKEITLSEWDKHNDLIGSTFVALLGGIKNINIQDFEGAESNESFLMPRSGLVPSNRAYRTTTLTKYGDDCFVWTAITKNPDVIYGNRSRTRTRLIVTDLGNNQCQFIGSWEPHWIGSAPIAPIAWKIKNEMKNFCSMFFAEMADFFSHHCQNVSDNSE